MAEIPTDVQAFYKYTLTADPVVRASDLQIAINAIVNQFNLHTHTDGTGETGPPIPPMAGIVAQGSVPVYIPPGGFNVNTL